MHLATGSALAPYLPGRGWSGIPYDRALLPEYVHEAEYHFSQAFALVKRFPQRQRERNLAWQALRGIHSVTCVASYGRLDSLLKDQNLQDDAYQVAEEILEWALVADDGAILLHPSPLILIARAVAGRAHQLLATGRVNLEDERLCQEAADLCQQAMDRCADFADRVVLSAEDLALWTQERAANFITACSWRFGVHADYVRARHRAGTRRILGSSPWGSFDESLEKTKSVLSEHRDNPAVAGSFCGESLELIADLEDSHRNAAPYYFWPGPGATADRPPRLFWTQLLVKGVGSFALSSGLAEIERELHAMDGPGIHQALADAFNGLNRKPGVESIAAASHWALYVRPRWLEGARRLAALPAVAHDDKVQALLGMYEGKLT